MSSQLWYAGRKLRIAGKFITNFFSRTILAINCGYEWRGIHDYIFFRVRYEQSTVATYYGISKLFIIHVRFYLFFRFTDKVRRTKTENFDVAKYCGKSHVYIFFRVKLFG